MNRISPPRWIEHLLLLLLPARDRDTVSGDLLEEFREQKLPHLGRTRASLWYARQVVSFAPRSPLLDTLERRSLILLCSFTALSGSWLGLVGLYRKHAHLANEAIAVIIVVQALLTLLALRFRHLPLLRFLPVAGCGAIVWLAHKAFIGLMTSKDFEGYIALIALALVAQAILTLLILMRAPLQPQPDREASEA